MHCIALCAASSSSQPIIPMRWCSMSQHATTQHACIRASGIGQDEVATTATMHTCTTHASCAVWIPTPQLAHRATHSHAHTHLLLNFQARTHLLAPPHKHPITNKGAVRVARWVGCLVPRSNACIAALPQQQLKQHSCSPQPGAPAAVARTRIMSAAVRLAPGRQTWAMPDAFSANAIITTWVHLPPHITTQHACWSAHVRRSRSAGSHEPRLLTGGLCGPHINRTLIRIPRNHKTLTTMLHNMQHALEKTRLKSGKTTAPVSCPCV